MIVSGLPLIFAFTLGLCSCSYSEWVLEAKHHKDNLPAYLREAYRRGDAGSFAYMCYTIPIPLDNPDTHFLLRELVEKDANRYLEPLIDSNITPGILEILADIINDCNEVKTKMIVVPFSFDKAREAIYKDNLADFFDMVHTAVYDVMDPEMLKLIAFLLDSDLHAYLFTLADCQKRLGNESLASYIEDALRIEETAREKHKPSKAKVERHPETCHVLECLTPSFIIWRSSGKVAEAKEGQIKMINPQIQLLREGNKFIFVALIDNHLDIPQIFDVDELSATIELIYDGVKGMALMIDTQLGIACLRRIGKARDQNEALPNILYLRPQQDEIDVVHSRFYHGHEAQVTFAFDPSDMILFLPSEIMDIKYIRGDFQAILGLLAGNKLKIGERLQELDEFRKSFRQWGVDTISEIVVACFLL